MKSTTKAVVEEVSKEPIIKEVKVQSLIDAHLVYTGKVSGRQYEWDRAGAIVSVYENDVAELLSKRLGTQTCCGDNRDGNVIFQLAE